MSLGVEVFSVRRNGHALLLPGIFHRGKAGYISMEGVQLFHGAVLAVAEYSQGDIILRRVLMVDEEPGLCGMEGTVPGLGARKVRQCPAQSLQFALLNGVQVHMAVALVAAGEDFSGRGAHGAVGMGDGQLALQGGIEPLVLHIIHHVTDAAVLV